jgi:hypothetical protein
MNEKTVRMIVHNELRESQQLMDIKKELVTIHGEIRELRDMIRRNWWIPLIVSAATITVAALIAHRS